MTNTREYLQEAYQAKLAGRLYPAVFTGKRGRKTPPSRRLAVDLDTELAAVNDLVYLMLVDGELKYIGYTATSLKTRMGNYAKGRFPSMGGTNKHIYDMIMESDLNVEILTIKPGTVLQFGLEIPLSRSLEYTLITQHDPEWNRRIR